MAPGSEPRGESPIASRIGSHWPGSTPAPWRRRTSPTSPRADAYVLGSGVYAGHWQKALAAFARSHAARLRQRPVWLFSSGPVGGPGRGRHPDRAPDEARELRRLLDARDHRVFAEALDRESEEGSDLSRLERAITRSFIPEGDWRDWDAIDRWADEIASTLLGTSVARSVAV